MLAGMPLSPRMNRYDVMIEPQGPSEFSRIAHRHLAEMVESVGIKRFATSMQMSTRHVNRTLSGAAPNPIERLIRMVQSASPEAGDRCLDFLCQEVGGHFVRHEALDNATVNAVRECAEAIAAISDGHISNLDIRDIREAIAALSSLILNLRDSSADSADAG
jgi:hypothetical protein